MPGNVSISESRAQPVIPPDVDFGMVVIGYTSESPLPAGQVSALYSSPEILAADYGVGDAVDAATQAITRTNDNASPPPIAIYPTPATTPGSMGTINVTGVTGTAVVSNTPGAEPRGTYEVVGRVADDGNDGNGGLIGSAGIVLEFSLDNGRTFMPTTALGTAFVKAVLLPDGNDTGASFSFAPSTTNAAYVTLAVELRADALAHLANAVAHDGADTSAAQLALAASSVPATVTASTAVINLVLAALVSHVVNITSVHDGPDLVAYTALAALSAATDTKTGIDLAIALKGVLNTHEGVSLVAAAAGLMGSIASIASPQTYTAASNFLAGGIAAMDAQPRRPQFVISGSGTPADMADSVTITGFDYAGNAQTETALSLTGLGTVTATKAFKGTGLSCAFVAADGTGATFTIGYSNGVHNSADVTNLITSPDPTYGTLKTGDTWSSLTAPPMWGNADLFAAGDPATGAFAAIADNSQEFGRIVITEPVATSNFSTLVAGLNYGLTIGKRWRLTIRFRDPTPGETDPAYVAAFQAFAAANHDDRITCIVGSGRLTDLFRAYVYQRSGLPAVLARWQANTVVPGRLGERLAQSPGYVARGPLENFTLVDENGQLIGHDEKQRGGIEGPLSGTGGGMTFYRTANADVPGTYASTIPPTMYPALSAIITEMDRAVANGVERTAVAISWTSIGGADIWDPVTFELDESIRNALQTKIAKAIRDRYSKEMQNADDPNLVHINPTVSVSGAQVTLTGTIAVRFYGYDHDIILTFSASR
jgi:hypothetical protein